MLFSDEKDQQTGYINSKKSNFSLLITGRHIFVQQNQFFFSDTSPQEINLYHTIASIYKVLYKISERKSTMPKHKHCRGRVQESRPRGHWIESRWEETVITKVHQPDGQTDCHSIKNMPQKQLTCQDKHHYYGDCINIITMVTA